MRGSTREMEKLKKEELDLKRWAINLRCRPASYFQRKRVANYLFPCVSCFMNGSTFCFDKSGSLLINALATHRSIEIPNYSINAFGAIRMGTELASECNEICRRNIRNSANRFSIHLLDEVYNINI